MSSLEEKLKEVTDIELAVCFFHKGSTEFKFVLNNVTYYPLEDEHKGFVGKLLSKLSTQLADHNVAGIKKCNK